MVIVSVLLVKMSISYCLEVLEFLVRSGNGVEDNALALGGLIGCSAVGGIYVCVESYEICPRSSTVANLVINCWRRLLPFPFQWKLN
jgi:hypothetical protein